MIAFVVMLLLLLLLLFLLTLSLFLLLLLLLSLCSLLSSELLNPKRQPIKVRLQAQRYFNPKAVILGRRHVFKGEHWGDANNMKMMSRTALCSASPTQSFA